MRIVICKSLLQPSIECYLLLYIDYLRAAIFKHLGHVEHILLFALIVQSLWHNVGNLSQREVSLSAFNPLSFILLDFLIGRSAITLDKTFFHVLTALFKILIHV